MTFEPEYIYCYYRKADSQPIYVGATRNPVQRDMGHRSAKTKVGIYLREHGVDNFVNLVKSQTGKKINATQSTALLSAAASLKYVVGCVPGDD